MISPFSKEIIQHQSLTSTSCDVYQPFKDKAQTVLFKGPVRTAQ
jgi:hypothetical protein